MERDKRGRFVKKAAGGLSLQTSQSGLSLNSNQNLGLSLNLGTMNFNTPVINTNFNSTFDQNNSNNSSLLTGNISLSGINPKTKIKYTIYNNGKMYDQFGKEINPWEFHQNKDKYEFDSSLNPILLGSNQNIGGLQNTEGTGENIEEVGDEDSSGFNLFDDSKFGTNIKNTFNNITSKPIDKNKLAGFLDITRAGIEASLNNRIADRALEAEKPFLQDVSESHRSVYGDYRAQVEGEKAAAKLRNMASQPMTSDGALQQQMMMDAQIKGQEYIDKGNAQDEAMIKQTREAAWTQEKENQQQRQAVAMQNRQAMLMTEKNKAQIENVRDSANITQVVSPLISGWEQRLRNDAAKQEYYQNYYDNEMVDREVWSNTSGLSADEISMINAYLTGGETGITNYINNDETKKQTWLQLYQKKQAEIIQKQAALKGVYINPNLLNLGGVGIGIGTPDWSEGAPVGTPIKKKGGTIYKARLVKRTKDNDRGAKSIESNKKIAARFLEKTLNSLYTYNDVEIIAKSKNKKKKYQAGGNLPFASHTPIFATSESGEFNPTQKSDSEDLTTKDVLSLLKDMDGLPADMQLIVGQLQNFNMKNPMDPLGLSSSSNIASNYLKVINQIKVAKFHREEYNNAFNQLKGNGGLNEFAITSDGLLIGSNPEGDFEYFTPDQVNAGEHKNQGYSLLTNSNLLYLRANSPDAAFNHQLTTVAQNGIGMEVITKQVNDILSNLGSSKESEEGFIKMGNNGQIKNGLQFLQKAAQEIGDSSITDNMSVADYYQAGYLTEDQANQAQLALQYIWSALPANAQSLLQIKGGSVKGAESIIQSLVYSKTSTESQFKATPKKMSKTGSGSSSSDDIDKLNLSPVQMMQVGYTDHQQVTLQKGTKYATVVNAQVLPITDVNKKLLGVTTLDRVAESTFGGALDMNNVTMGSQLIDPHALQNVQIDSTNLYVMNLPIDRNSLDGTIKPDLSWMSKIEEIDKIIREGNITDISQINKLYTDAGLPVLMDDNGQLNLQDYCKFGVLNGHALNTAFKDLDLLDSTVLEIDDEDSIENVLSILNKGRNEKDRIDFDSKSWADSIFGTKHDSLYEGTIYIPIRTNAFTGMIGGGQYPTTETAEEIEALIQQQERTRGYVDPGLLI